MKKYSKCYIKEEVRNKLNLPNTQYTIIDVLEQQVEYRFVLTCHEMGKGWVEFFRVEELIEVDAQDTNNSDEG